MDLKHIFNEVKENNGNTKIPAQGFTTEYIKEIIENQKSSQNFSTKFNETEDSENYRCLYFNALRSGNSDGIISDFDNKNLERILNKVGETPILISGDFWGIQSFIFDGLGFKNATKIIRSRSALVKIINFIM
ncbi:hypothetical protein ThvES_00011790 [Thiovulum sp. ES]|nr:hypothetical protein ThvES_00011790 [Thiovulum sp. ES]